MGDPVRQADLGCDDGPDCVKPGEGVEPDVQEDPLAAAQGREDEHDVQPREGSDERRDREVDAAEPKCNCPQTEGEDERHEAAKHHTAERVESDRPDGVAEGVRPHRHEDDVAEVHVSGEARDEVQGIRERGEDQEVDQDRQRKPRDPRGQPAQDEKEHTDAP